jgi:hypothetical protein
MPDHNELLAKLISTFGEASRDVLNSVINDEVASALKYEKERELKRAVAAFYEAQVKDDIIIRLVEKYWGIDYRKAVEILRIEKTVNSPIRLLIAYMQEQGYKISDIETFVKHNNVKEKLENDISLWKLSPDKLLKELKLNRQMNIDI